MAGSQSRVIRLATDVDAELRNADSRRITADHLAALTSQVLTRIQRLETIRRIHDRLREEARLRVLSNRRSDWLCRGSSPWTSRATSNASWCPTRSPRMLEFGDPRGEPRDERAHVTFEEGPCGGTTAEQCRHRGTLEIEDVQVPEAMAEREVGVDGACRLDTQDGKPQTFEPQGHGCEQVAVPSFAAGHAAEGHRHAPKGLLDARAERLQKGGGA